MNYAEVKDLLNSGFTPEQIISLTTSGAIPSAPEMTPADVPPLPEVSESPIKEEAPESVPETPGASSEGDNNPDPLDEIRETVRQLQAENKQLREQIQTANIREMTMETVNTPDAAATLAEIIRPTFNRKGG